MAQIWQYFFILKFKMVRIWCGASRLKFKLAQTRHPFFHLEIQDGPKMARRWHPFSILEFKMAPRWPDDGTIFHLEIQDGTIWPDMAQDGSNMATMLPLQIQGGSEIFELKCQYYHLYVCGGANGRHRLSRV